MSDNSSSLPSAGSAYRSGLAKPTIGATTISLLATAATGAAAASLAPGLAPAAVDMIEAGTAILGAGFGWYLGVREKGSL